MQGPFVDPVVEEIRRIRDEHAARFDYDIAAIFEDMKREQKESGIAVVSLFSKRILKPAKPAIDSPGR